MVAIENLQLNAQGKLQHFLSIEGLQQELLTEILDTAESFAGITAQHVKKYRCYGVRLLLIYFLKIALGRVLLLNWQQQGFLLIY